MPLLLRDITQRLADLLPLRWAEPWDNVGLLAGDPEQTIDRIVVCQDWTRGALERARVSGDLSRTLVVAYHPPWFSAAKRLVAEGDTGLLYATIRSGAGVYSVHTALDAAPFGTNDALARAAGLVAAEPLQVHRHEASRAVLRVTVPPADVERVRAALTAAGAGTIGLYRGCMFELGGTGSFLPEEGAQPAVGQVGVFHREAEAELTTWLPLDAQLQANILHALRTAHPYEEPVFDIFRPEALPLAQVGQGRVGELDSAAPFESFVESLKQATGAFHLLCALPQSDHARRPVQRIAVAAGAGRSLRQAAARAGADVFVTGELPHHDALAARDAGMRVLSLLHGVSERIGVDAWAKMMQRAMGDVLVERATGDVDPYHIA